jgi:hypothetical protein
MEAGRLTARSQSRVPHHVCASLIHFAQTKARCLHTPLPHAVSPSPLLQLSLGTSCSASSRAQPAIRDRCSPPSVQPLSPPAKGYDFARLRSGSPTPFQEPVLIGWPPVSTTVRAPARCGPRRESIACHRSVERCAGSSTHSFSQTAKSPLEESSFLQMM